MALFVSRFGHFPHIFKLVVLILNICLIVVLCKSPTLPAGAPIVWLTIIFSVLVDVLLSILLLFELEIQIFPLGFVSYGLVERTFSIIFVVAYFTCMWLIFGESRLSNKGWFTSAALLCLAQTATYLANFTMFLRQWMREVREARAEASLLHDEV